MQQQAPVTLKPQNKDKQGTRAKYTTGRVLPSKYFSRSWTWATRHKQARRKKTESAVHLL